MAMLPSSQRWQVEIPHFFVFRWEILIDVVSTLDKLQLWLIQER